MMKIHDFFILLKFLTKMEDFLTYSFLLVVDRTRALSVSSFRIDAGDTYTQFLTFAIV